MENICYSPTKEPVGPVLPWADEAEEDEGVDGVEQEDHVDGDDVAHEAAHVPLRPGERLVDVVQVVEVLPGLLLGHPAGVEEASNILIN